MRTSLKHLRCRRWRSLAAAGLLLWFVAGCRAGDKPPAADGTPEPGGVAAVVTRIVEQITVVTSTPDPAAPEAPRDPIELDVSLNGSLPDLDPGRAESETQLDLAQNLFIGLTNYDAATDTIQPELATSWETSADGRVWTFNLRDDVFWSRPTSPLPGSEALWSADAVRPVTADDVVFAIQRACARDVESPLAFTLFLIAGCEPVFLTLEPTDADRAAVGIRAVDPTTLEVTLDEPAGYFLTLTSMPFFQPVPRELVTELGDEWLDAAGNLSTGWQTPGNLVTSGPFLPVISEITSQSMTLHRNPLWPLDMTGNADIVNVFFLDDEQDAYDLWQQRSLDIAPLPAGERETFISRTPEKVLIIPDDVLFYIGFDFQSQVFREPEVRRAFSAAIDRQRLVDEIYDGRGLVMRHVITPGVVATIPPAEVGVGYSPDYAKEQMAASSIGDCRLIPEIRMVVSSADLSLRQAELIRDMWVDTLDCPQENIHIEQVSFGGLLVATRPGEAGRPDLWELAWAPTFPDAHNLLTDLLHCQDSEDRQNRDCAEADTLLRRAAVAVDPAERAALYRQAEALFFSETGLFPIAPLYILTREWIVHDWIDFAPVTFGGQQWDRIAIDAALKGLERSR